MTPSHSVGLTRSFPLHFNRNVYRPTTNSVRSKLGWNIHVIFVRGRPTKMRAVHAQAANAAVRRIMRGMVFWSRRRPVRLFTDNSRNANDFPLYADAALQ